MSMDGLSQAELTVAIASIKARSVEEEPGIVSVVTTNQIRDTGARDLSDVLMLVPGSSVDEDVQSMAGLTIRGMRAQEGKALLIVDGVEVNEPLLGSLPILNHIPADMIEQLEIIRGPRAAQYGGDAGLSAIRVTPKGAALDGCFNGQDISMAGFKPELRWDRPAFSTYLSYSRYRADQSSKPYVRADDSHFLGAPSDRVTVSGTWHINKRFDWNISGSWLGGLFAYADPSAEITGVPSEFVLNSSVAHRFDRSSVGVGAANLLNSERLAPRPCAGGAAPCPPKGRKIHVKFGFSF